MLGNKGWANGRKAADDCEEKTNLGNLSMRKVDSVLADNDDDNGDNDNNGDTDDDNDDDKDEMICNWRGTLFLELFDDTAV